MAKETVDSTAVDSDLVTVEELAAELAVHKTTIYRQLERRKRLRDLTEKRGGTLLIRKDEFLRSWGGNVHEQIERTVGSSRKLHHVLVSMARQLELYPRLDSVGLIDVFASRTDESCRKNINLALREGIHVCVAGRSLGEFFLPDAPLWRVLAERIRSKVEFHVNGLVVHPNCEATTLWTLLHAKDASASTYQEEFVRVQHGYRQLREMIDRHKSRATISVQAIRPVQYPDFLLAASFRRQPDFMLHQTLSALSSSPSSPVFKFSAGSDTYQGYREWFRCMFAEGQDLSQQERDRINQLVPREPLEAVSVGGSEEP